MIALIGLVAGVALVDFASLLDNAAKPSPYETLRAVVETAREHARNAGMPVRVTFDSEAGALKINDGGATEAFPFGLPAEVSFVLPAEEAEGGERPLDSLVFHPSGCALPAAILLTVRGERTRYRMEPFSAALEKETAR